MEILKKLNAEEKNSAFLYILNIIENTTDIDKKIKIINKLLKSKLIYGNKYYSSNVIENILIKKSNSLKTVLSNEYSKNTVLHIMTKSYYDGGHTRVVERWIENPLDQKKHSLLLTEQKSNSINERLYQAVIDKKGEVISIYDNENLYKKAIRLRQIASKYEIIVLHIHNYDILPILAFANKDFKRPIALYNHSDHLFWIGVCISDIILELRTYGTKISRNYRDIKRNFFLGIPIDNNIYHNNKNKNLLKDKLQIPINKKVIISLASSYKFTTYKNFNFLTIVDKILSNNQNTFFIIIGANVKKLKWDINNKNIKIIEKLPYEKLIDYINIADLYIDSFPLGGGTTLIDIANHQIPILSLRSFIPQFDFTIKSNTYCKNIEQLLHKTSQILKNENYKQIHIDNMNSIIKKINQDYWNSNINNFYNIIESKEHKIYNFNSKCHKNLSTNDFLCNLYKNNVFSIVKIVGLFNFIKYLIKGIK